MIAPGIVVDVCDQIEGLLTCCAADGGLSYGATTMISGPWVVRWNLAISELVFG